MSNAMVKVDFYGDTLEACQRDGKVWVSLNAMCAVMGVTIDSQRQKLKKAAWATTAIITGVAEDGKRRDVTVIDLDTLPGWLFSLNAGKVRDEVRDKLVRYQREAARVLADHFLKRTVAEPVDAIIAVGEAIVSMRRHQLEQERKLAAVQVQLDRVEQKIGRAQQTADAAQQTADSQFGWYSVLAWCKRIGRHITVHESAAAGKKLSAIMKRSGRQPQQVSDPRFGFVNLYPEPLLMDHFRDGEDLFAPCLN